MNILNPRRNDRGDTEGIFRMEFPLMQWMVACLFKILGNHLIITRLFMFIVGFFTVFGVYRLLNSLFRNTLLSVFGAWAFNFSPSFYYYTINPLPDNLALCCSIWGLALFLNWYHDKKLIHLISSGILLSVGALCKLPFIVFFVVPFAHFVKLNFRNGFKRETFTLAFGALVSSVLPMAWYLIVVPQWKGNMIVKGMLGNNDTVRTLVDYLQFHLVSTLPESLLNYGSVLFFLAGFYFLIKRKSYRDERFALLLALSLLVLTYFFFEINAIAKAHDYYLFPFYPLLFILVPYGAYHMYRSKIKFFKYLTIVLLLILPFTCYLRFKGRWNSSSPGSNKDLLMYKTELRDAVPKNALVVAGNDESHYIFFYTTVRLNIRWGTPRSPEAAEMFGLGCA